MENFRRFKIAQIAPIAERVPPKKYGGTERVVWALTEELVSRGHDVTLFATGDSKTSAKLDSVYPVPLREAKIRDIYGSNEYTLLNIGHAYSQERKFDIIHDHCASLSIPTANLSKTPVVMTMHGAFDIYNRRLFQMLRNPKLVTISNAQAIPVPELNYVGTVYHGLPMEKYPFGAKHDGYLLFVGRISMQKGVHFAIDVAQYLNIPLIIAAKLDDTDRPYYKEYIEPRLSNGFVKWVGEVDEAERNKLMSRAMCLLHPITWREPFGLTMIEAMACGCPVVAFNLGSVPEIIIDGKTGYISGDIEGMIDDVMAIGAIDRAYCRKYALSRFGVKRMADEYEEIYFKVLESEKSKEKIFHYSEPVFSSASNGFVLNSPGQQNLLNSTKDQN